jgi:hypothetical protein
MGGIGRRGRGGSGRGLRRFFEKLRVRLIGSCRREYI